MAARSRLPRRLVVVILVGAVGSTAAAAGTLVARSRAVPNASGTPTARSSDPGAGRTPGPQAAAVPTASAAPVAPLRRLVSPDIYLTASRPLTRQTLDRIKRAPGVAELVSVDVGELTVAGRRVGAIGVEPSAFRSFTPRLTAESDELWRSVATAELAASFRSSRELRLPLGQSLPVTGLVDADVRVGAFADTGVPGADLVVSRSLAATLGLSRTGVLISAPKADPLVLRKALTDILGRAGRVQLLRRPVLIAQRTVPIPAGLASIPPDYLRLYQDAARTCAGLPWPILAAIGAVESAHGLNAGVSSAGAMGPMQFLPSSFAAYGVDGNGDGRLEINNPVDAIYSAANYLCNHGAGRGGQALYDAVFAYNHADWYVRKVFGVAQQYAAASRS